MSTVGTPLTPRLPAFGGRAHQSSDVETSQSTLFAKDMHIMSTSLYSHIHHTCGHTIGLHHEHTICDRHRLWHTGRGLGSWVGVVGMGRLLAVGRVGWRWRRGRAVWARGRRGLGMGMAVVGAEGVCEISGRGGTLVGWISVTVCTAILGTA